MKPPVFGGIVEALLYLFMGTIVRFVEVGLLEAQYVSAKMKPSFHE